MKRGASLPRPTGHFNAEPSSLESHSFSAQPIRDQDQTQDQTGDCQCSIRGYIVAALLIIGLVAPFFMHPAIGAISAGMGVVGLILYLKG